MSIISVDYGEITGGGSEPFIQGFTLAASARPQITNLPITPRKVYWICTGDSPSQGNVLTNVNQTTGQVDGNWYQSVGGGAYTVSAESFTISGNSITFDASAWSSSQQGGAWVIFE